MGFLFPSKKFNIESSRSLVDLRTDLMSSVQDKWISGSEPGVFIGKVEDNSFSIYPHPYGRNSFVPNIKGEFRETDSGCVTSIKMSLWSPILLFEILGYISLAPMMLISLLPAINDGDFTFFLFTILFFVLSQALTRVAFYFPARSSERRLRKILS